MTIEHKLDMFLAPISPEQALNVIRKHHYSKTLAAINKECLGVYINNELEGTITLD